MSDIRPNVHSKFVVELIRRPHPGGDHFMFIRNGRAAFIPADCVTPFYGDRAWFEVELLEDGRWQRWRAVRSAQFPFFS